MTRKRPRLCIWSRKQKRPHSPIATVQSSSHRQVTGSPSAATTGCISSTLQRKDENSHSGERQAFCRWIGHTTTQISSPAARMEPLNSGTANREQESGSPTSADGGNDSPTGSVVLCFRGFHGSEHHFLNSPSLGGSGYKPVLHGNFRSPLPSPIILYRFRFIPTSPEPARAHSDAIDPDHHQRYC